MLAPRFHSYENDVAELNDLLRAGGGTIRRRSFSLTELLVVIGIIVLLVGLLLIALGRARAAAQRTQTLATMRSFLSACEAFRVEHGYNPGLVPEVILAYHNHAIAHGTPGIVISGMENALMHLMGGYVIKGTVTQAEWDALRPEDGWDLYDIVTGAAELSFKFNMARLGTGPVIDGKPYGPYFSPDEGEVTVISPDFGQWPMTPSVGSTTVLPRPVLVDAWGQPIMYIRQARSIGKLVGTVPKDPTIPNPQFYMESIWPYVLARSQQWSSTDPELASGSILYGSLHVNGQESWNVDKAVAVLIRHPTIQQVDPLSPLIGGVAKGSIFLLSAGPDGIYYSAADGPGTIGKPIGSGGYIYDDFLADCRDPKLIDTFDDIRIHGGGL